MPEDVIQVRDQFYILATAARMHEPGRVLKHNDTFTVFDRYGDIQAFGLGEQGLYHEGTRFLSRFVLRLGPDRPLLLSSRVRSENDLFVADLTNPDITRDGRLVLPRDLVHVFRCRFVYGGACYERLRVCSYSQERIELPVWIWFDADYADIFEVRGTPRLRRGEGLPPELHRSAAVIGYRGLDDVVRRTRLTFDPPPDRLEPTVAKFDVALERHEVATITVVVSCEIEDGRRAAVVLPYEAAAVEAARVTERPPAACRVTTSNERFNAWLARSYADVRMMVSDTPYGPYPYAGVPWFSTAFGRDGIITARELLWVDPQLARGVLSYLAATQAAAVDEARDAEPGKILHETRRGEMAALGEVPFGLYYGSVDATPLFLMLAGAYYVRTGDLAFIESIWPNIERALAWIDRAGDRDGDGFVEYIRFSPTGLAHQGWKDSSDAVFHADGRLAEPPIALCEVQGYVYDARRSVATLAEALGDRAAAERLRRQAERLRQQVEEAFWIEELSTYALALDGRKQPCRVRTSNAGHLLFCGLPSAARAARVARTLLDLDSYSGWGIRTVSAAERRYNPMSYHNGSVWPHDNALIAAGLSRYGLQEEVLTVLRGLFDASEHVELCRMPELFCGFHRRPGQGATLYPVACAPQAWAAAAVFLLLEACLGLEIDGRCGRITLRRPRLPDFLREVRVENLRVGPTSVDLLFERHPADVGVSVLRRDGEIEIIVVK
jgi:glycogen debranching enzyme